LSLMWLLGLRCDFWFMIYDFVLCCVSALSFMRPDFYETGITSPVTMHMPAYC
jgi:hypothetical protein